tara:strand:+ start:8201 stop:9199 length:999 start_codon:yes stop_codon:yes gene_type:complete
MTKLAGVDVSAPYLLLGAAVLYVAYNIAFRLHKDAQIRKLGARAPVRKSYMPFGVDMAYDVVNHAMKDLTYEMWVSMFEKWAGPGGYTVEAGVGERVILTAEPENIKAILATQFKDYGKGEQFRKDWHAFLGNGIFTTDGQLWHNSRQLIRPQFVKDRLSDIEIFEEHVQVLITKLGQGQEIDTLDMMFRYTLDAATHFLMGASVDSLQNPQTLFADAFYNAQRVQSIIAKVGYVRRNWELSSSNVQLDRSTGWCLANAWASTARSRSSTTLWTVSLNKPSPSHRKNSRRKRITIKATPSCTPLQAIRVTARHCETSSSPSCWQGAIPPLAH